MDQTLVFGWRTSLLALAFAQLVSISVALTWPARNRAANRTLASLLVVLAGMITPWMIGFAGFYERWQWLSFAPFAIPFAIAPLVYLYVRSLAFGEWPKSGWHHLVPAIVQFAYLATMFLMLRQPAKNSWLDRSSFAYDLIVCVGVVAGFAVYGVASRKLISSYRVRLSAQRSDDHRFALAWLERAIAALFVLLAVWAIFDVWNLVSPLGYSGLMGLYVAISAFALFLAIEGWRHSTAPFPTIGELEPQQASTPDWGVKAEVWAGRIRQERLYADPELSVAQLARILGTNTAYVSRAFNEGLGSNFSSFINQLRCEEVAAHIRGGAGTGLLDLALASGFSSKPSFNRAFLATFGCSPSAYRRAHGSISK